MKVLLLSVLLAASSCVAQKPLRQTLIVGPKKVAYDVFGEETNGPTLIILHSASGPTMTLNWQEAKFFTSHGYRVWIPHYFDATRSSEPSDANYSTWVQVVKKLVEENSKSSIPAQRKAMLLGFSLGASVALAAGSQQANVAAIAEWYGSLPDTFFYTMKGMPPLLILHGGRDQTIPVMNALQLIKLCGLKQLTCDSHIYPKQGHGFDFGTVKDADSRTLTFFDRFK
jgi:carboxymethylenebutenolidase